MEIKRNSVWRRSWSFALLALLLFGLSGCMFFSQAEERKAPPLMKLKEEVFEVVPVERRDVLNRIIGTGTLVPKREYPAAFKTGDILDTIDVVSGEAVSKGDILAQLDTSDLEDQIKAQKLTIQKLKLIYGKLRKVPNIDSYTLRLSRLDIESAEKQLELLKTEYESHLLRAPADGIVEYIEAVHSGDYIQPYQDIIQLANPNQLRVAYPLDELDASLPFNEETSVMVTIGKKNYQGVIEMTPFSISPYERLEKYSKAILINVKDLPPECKMGDTVGVEFLFEEKENVLTIPKQALRTYLSRQYVVVMDGNTRKEVDVEVGLKGPSIVEIVSGLGEGQQVVLR